MFETTKKWAAMAWIGDVQSLFGLAFTNPTNDS